ncbi:MAG: hypothetical protein ACREWE_14955 [Gammaproteobacteria bacterium]
MRGILKNPSYAGMYVFGRYQYRREISSDGEVHKRTGCGSHTGQISMNVLQQT